MESVVRGCVLTITQRFHCRGMFDIFVDSYIRTSENLRTNPEKHITTERFAEQR